MMKLGSLRSRTGTKGQRAEGQREDSSDPLDPYPLCLFAQLENRHLETIHFQLVV